MGAAPGLALEGSNRALLYLFVFALLTTVPWTDRAVTIVLVTFVGGIGVIAVVLLLRFASANGLSHLLLSGRLLAPTGYVNSNAALFTLTALMGTALATRRELPGPVRGLLVASACAALQLAVMAQSRGWLFTLPLVLLVTICVVRDRMRFVGFAVIPVAATLVIVHHLTGVFAAAPGSAQAHAARIAGQRSVLLCAGAFVLATLVAWADQLLPRREHSPVSRRVLGAILAVATLGAGAAGSLAATHGHPVPFLSSASGTGSAIHRRRTPVARTSRPSAAIVSTSGGWPGTPPRPIRSEVSARTTSASTTQSTGVRMRSRRGRTASSCNSSRAPVSSASRCLPCSRRPR